MDQDKHGRVFWGRKGFVNQVSWNQFEDLRNFRKGSKRKLCVSGYSL